MSAKRCLQIGSVAVLAALVLGTFTSVQAGSPGPPAIGAPPAPPMVRPPVPPGPPTAGLPPMNRPPALPSQLSIPSQLPITGRPPMLPRGDLGAKLPWPPLPASQSVLLARPNLDLPTSLSPSRPSHWAPQEINRNWQRPIADLAALQSTPPAHNKSTLAGQSTDGRRSLIRWQIATWKGDRTYYPWSGYDSNGSSYPYYGNSYPYDNSYSYGKSSTRSEHPYDGARSASYDQYSRFSSRSSELSNQTAPSSGVQDRAASTEEPTSATDRHMRAACQAFQNGNYLEAESECGRANHLSPSDANIQEFRALCQFSQSKYQEAASTLHQVLAVGPGWSWETVSSFYTSPSTYTTQLRALEQYVRKNPKDASGRFVLGYHYFALESREAAIGQLREVVKLEPKDQFSRFALNALETGKIGKERPRPDESPLER